MLSGVRIVALSQMLAGPYGSMLLGDLAAEVIKIEDPRGGVPTRRIGSPFVEGEGGHSLPINRNKRRVALDLRQAEGRQVRCTRINTLDRVFSEPHAPARQMVAEVDHPAVGRLRSIGNPVKASPQGQAPLRLAPSLRQHAEEVLCDVLEHIPSHLGGCVARASSARQVAPLPLVTSMIGRLITLARGDLVMHWRTGKYAHRH